MQVFILFPFSNNPRDSVPWGAHLVNVHDGLVCSDARGRWQSASQPSPSMLWPGPSGCHLPLAAALPWPLGPGRPSSSPVPSSFPSLSAPVSVRSPSSCSKKTVSDAYWAGKYGHLGPNDPQDLHVERLGHHRFCTISSSVAATPWRQWCEDRLRQHHLGSSVEKHARNTYKKALRIFGAWFLGCSRFWLAALDLVCRCSRVLDLGGIPSCGLLFIFISYPIY